MDCSIAGISSCSDPFCLCTTWAYRGSFSPMTALFLEHVISSTITGRQHKYRNVGRPSLEQYLHHIARHEIRAARKRWIKLVLSQGDSASATLGCLASDCLHVVLVVAMAAALYVCTVYLDHGIRNTKLPYGTWRLCWHCHGFGLTNLPHLEYV